MQRYIIAGIKVDIDVKYERLKNQAKPYISADDKSEAQITLKLNEAVYEKARQKYPFLSDENLEYMLYGFMFCDKLLDFNGIVLHSSAVALGGYAYLFSADSGVGKSTHTGFYLELFKEKAVIVNDDKPVIREINGKLYCFGSPFSGKHDISVNKGYPLGGICFLSRGKSNIIEKIDSKEAVKYAYKQTQSMNSTESIEKRLDMLDKLLSKADLYKMQCTNDVTAAKVSFSKMKKSIPVYLDEVSDILEQLKKQGKVKFRTKGKSMYPLLIGGRDSVVLEHKDNINKNDIVLYKNKNGKYILHRVKKINKNEIITRGEALTYYDDAVKKDNIIATAVSFERKGKTVTADNIFYRIFSAVYTSDIFLKIRILKGKIKRNTRLK